MPAQRLGHLAIARDALLRYVALADERDVDPGTTERLASLTTQPDRARRSLF